MKMNPFAITALSLAVASLCAQAQPIADEPSAENDVVESFAADHHSFAKAAAVWAEGNTYTVGTVVSYNGQLYTALVTHTAFVGANWNPAATPSLWKPGGTDSGGGGGGGGGGTTGTAGITSGATYKLINPNSGLVLDVGGCSTANGANVQVWADGVGVCASGGGQAWTPTLNADGTYTLVNPNSSKALDVAGCGTANGTNVQIWANGVGVCNNGAGQKWKINANSDGTYTLVNPNSSKALDVAGAGKTNGTNVSLYDQNSGVAQKWRFATWTATNPGGGGGGGGGGTSGLAKHALVGYWHNFPNPSGPTFPISQVSNAWDVIVIAFADNAGGGNVSFTLDPSAGSEAQFIADVAAKRAQGKKVVLSLGGQNGTVSVGSSSEATNFANSLAQIIKKYGFDGIDLDLENGVTQGAPIQTYLPIAVKNLKSQIGSGFYLSMAPEWVYVEGGFTVYGGIWGSYIPIINDLRNELSILHPQYYNNGSVYTPYSTQPYAAGSTDQLVATARMLIEGFAYGPNRFAGLRPDQVGFGVPSGPSSAGSGFTTPANVNNALDCLTALANCGSVRPNQAYPSFRGVMTWSINWDRRDGFNFSNPVSSKLRSLP